MPRTRRAVAPAPAAEAGGLQWLRERRRLRRHERLDEWLDRLAAGVLLLSLPALACLLAGP